MWLPVGKSGLQICTPATPIWRILCIASSWAVCFLSVEGRLGVANDVARPSWSSQVRVVSAEWAFICTGNPAPGWAEEEALLLFRLVPLRRHDSWCLFALPRLNGCLGYLEGFCRVTDAVTPGQIPLSRSDAVIVEPP